VFGSIMLILAHLRREKYVRCGGNGSRGANFPLHYTYG